MTNVSFKGALALASDIRSRRIGCLELLDYFWERTRRFNAKLNAIVVDDLDAPELARGQRTRRSGERKPGVPCTVSQLA